LQAATDQRRIRIYAVAIQFPLPDDAASGVQEDQVEFSTGNQARKSPDGADDHVLDHDVESAVEEDARHHKRPAYRSAARSASFSASAACPIVRLDHAGWRRLHADAASNRCASSRAR